MLLDCMPGRMLRMASTGVVTMVPLLANASFDVGSDTVRIFGGEPTGTCEWPTTVGFGGCTGTLVHPQVVLTAGHCSTPRKVYFGERYRGGIAKTLVPKFCMKNPGYTGKPGLGGDSHFCVLNEAVKDIPIAPIAYGCELEQIKAGAKIWLVGFGRANGATAGSGVKHKVEVSINSVHGNVGELKVGGNGKATCYGDSGGPAFMKMSDGSWRTVGITSYGTSSQCGYPSGLTMASSAVKWIQKAIRDKGLDIDLQPCYDDDGKWAPTKECGGFAMDPGKTYGDWRNMCSQGAPKSGPSSICGPKNSDANSGSDSNKKKKASVDIDWSKGVGMGDEVEEGHAFRVKVKLGGNIKAVDHLLLVVNGKKEHKAQVDQGWKLEDLASGEYKLVARAVGEDDDVLAKTKEINLTVLAADGSSAEENSKEEDNDQELDEENSLAGEEASQEAKSDREKEDAHADKGQAGGCSIGAAAPATTWGTVLLALVGVGRNRRAFTSRR